ncbi:hypothetical protein U0037_20660 [Pseudomonas marginalis]|uniref:Uncharacterized protein n=1 Tax=Pseudomonas fluorescens TaxID=294 RepID=A0ACD4XMS6_PSEFL|nr:MULTISPECIES: hypothetical protein [Pseudomonas fluorescens group]WQD70463.1 hypothetical protein U0037_20660 [Pseudomonas marginalis]
MSEESEIIYVADLTGILGRTEASIREGVRRGVPWLPKGFKMDIRHCWLRADVMQFLRNYRDGRVENKPARLGRKRQTPPTLQSAS